MLATAICHPGMDRIIATYDEHSRDYVADSKRHNNMRNVIVL